MRFPAAQVRKQPRRDRRRRLTLLGLSLADRLAIKNAAIKINKRAARLGKRRCRCDRTRSAAGIEADQNEPRNMPQWPPFREYRTALRPPRVNRLFFSVVPIVNPIGLTTEAESRNLSVL